MLINELPDDCLLIIFGFINELSDLINCFTVCSKWSDLVTERTRTVKYLFNELNYNSDCVNCRIEEPIDGTCLSTLFPNLIIAEFSPKFVENVRHEDLVALVKNTDSLKGLIYSSDDIDDSIFKYCDKLEMAASDSIEPHIIENGAKLRQLYLWNCDLDCFKEDAHFFPNLERLNICNNEGNADQYYDGPELSKLKILELMLPSLFGDDTYYGFQFIDSCPSLQSAHVIVDTDRLYVDESLKHNCLRDLVLDFFYNDRIDWNELKRLFMKYPNLKHLSLRNNKSLENERVKELIRILPNLVLFDISGSPGVTQAAADYTHDYCKRYGRSIKFYFDGNRHEIESDWPQLSTKCEKSGQGFDFMKHCFLKRFHELSVFLVPNDDKVN